jgi:hypothetical protein
MAAATTAEVPLIAALVFEALFLLGPRCWSEWFQFTF